MRRARVIDPATLEHLLRALTADPPLTCSGRRSGQKVVTHEPSPPLPQLVGHHLLPTTEAHRVDGIR